MPHDLVMPLAAAMVTQCGLGTLTKALAVGLPLVCIPMLADQPGNAALVVAHGAGVRLSPARAQTGEAMTVPYDVITVGGGLAGSALAKCLAERGCRVLVLERETRFGDRVRGEQMHPWGVAEARTLGLYQRLAETCGHQTRWWTTYAGGSPVRTRDLEQTPHRAGSFNLYHPDMQETLIGMAAEAGAEVRRGVSVDSVRAGSPASVSFHENGHLRELAARLVVGADGRASQVRQWAEFTVSRDPDLLSIAGALVEGAHLPPDDGVHVAGGPGGRVLIAPQGNQRARVYFMSRLTSDRPPLSGKRHESDFLAACRATVAPADWFDESTVIGPLAQFNAADSWVDHPAQPGLVLIGDAAAASNPCFGSGLSLTLLGVRQLRDRLLANSDWDTAIEEYARDHAESYGALHRVTGWSAELFYSIGPAADERRARVLPRLAAEPERAPDIVGLGPASPSDDATRRFVLGEEEL